MRPLEPERHDDPRKKQRAGHERVRSTRRTVKSRPFVVLVVPPWPDLHANLFGRERPQTQDYRDTDGPGASDHTESLMLGRGHPQSVQAPAGGPPIGVNEGGINARKGCELTARCGGVRHNSYRWRLSRRSWRWSPPGRIRPDGSALCRPPQPSQNRPWRRRPSAVRRCRR